MLPQYYAGRARPAVEMATGPVAEFAAAVRSHQNLRLLNSVGAPRPASHSIAHAVPPARRPDASPLSSVGTNHLMMHLRAVAQVIAGHGGKTMELVRAVLAGGGLLAGSASRRRDCHSAAPPSPFSRCFNRVEEGGGSKMTDSADG